MEEERDCAAAGSVVDGKGGELAVANQRRSGRIDDDGIVEGDFVVAVNVNVAEANVVGVRYLDGVKKRLIAADDAVAVIVGDGDIAGVVDGKRKAERAFAAFFFGLQGVDLPVGGVLELYFVADVVLAGKLVDAAFG